MKRILAVLTGMVLLSACTVVDLDADGNPILPKDPHAKPSYTTQTPQQIAEETWQPRVMTTANSRALSWADMEAKSQTVKPDGRESVFVRASGTASALDESNPRERTLTLTINGKPVAVSVGAAQQRYSRRRRVPFRGVYKSGAVRPADAGA